MIYRKSRKEQGGGVVVVFRPAVLPFMRMVPDNTACLYYTGIDPFTKKEVFVANGLKDSRTQHALMQFFEPSNYFEVREALIQAKRTDLVGGFEGLIPA